MAKEKLKKILSSKGRHVYYKKYDDALVDSGQGFDVFKNVYGKWSAERYPIIEGTWAGSGWSGTRRPFSSIHNFKTKKEAKQIT